MDLTIIKLTFLIVVCSPLADCTAVDPEILEGPVTQVVPITQTEARFTCHARGNAAFWIINNEALFGTLPPCVTMKYPDDHDTTTAEVIKTIGIRVTLKCNGTDIKCVASGDNSGNDVSSPAFLYVAVAPSQPEPTLTTLNKTALQVSWSESNSQDGFPVLSYTLNIRNLTSSSLIDTVVLSDTNASSFQYVFTVDSVLSECHTISVEVTANNSVGGSSPGGATGGFPITLGNFLLPPTVDVTFSTDLSPKVNVTFKPPLICWFQEAMYELILFDVVTGAQILHARRGEYIGNEIPIVSELHEFGIDSEKDYKADVIVGSLFSERTNASVLFNTSFKPPSQDNLQLTILNSTAISVEWNRTSIFHQDVEISYTLVIRNETDDFHLGEEVFNVSANFSSYPMFYVYNSDGHISSGCHNISFIIFASNSFGESERPARAVTGFPRGLSNFSASLHANVRFTARLEPEVAVTFEYPSICWYQSGTYMIQIFDATGKVEMSVGPRQYNSKENSHITEDFQSGLNKDQMYKVVVTAESFGESVQAEEMFSTSHILPPNVPDTTAAGGLQSTPGPDIGMIAGIAVGCCLILVCLLVISIVCVIAHLRRRKRKAERQRRPPLPQIPNPLYETGGPIYEEIPGEKNFNTLVKPQSTAPCTPCSEYVMIEGKLNGDADHYDRFCVSEKDFEDIKLPLDELSTKSLGPTSCSFPEAPPFTAREDPYTLMNPAGGVCTSGEQAEHCQSLPRNSSGSQIPIRPSLSLPMVSQRVGRQESETGDTPEERYVRTSLLI